jgi:hypothetical protein
MVHKIVPVYCRSSSIAILKCRGISVTIKRDVEDQRVTEDAEPADHDLSEILRGKTLRIYYRMVQSGRSWTARELQREMGWSSPSLSLYHLEKLKNVGLVAVDSDGMYKVSRTVRVGILRYFVPIGGQLAPRFLCYTVFFASILVLSFLAYGLTIHPVDITLVLVLSIGCLIFAFETAWLVRNGIDSW